MPDSFRIFSADYMFFGENGNSTHKTGIGGDE
jgi:hypothetical protein